MIHSVSILIPTHNRAEVLRQTLGSFSGLCIPASLDVELVVVANACTDSTVDVCRGSIAGLPIPARYVEEPQAGLSVARNRAIAETTAGEFAASLGAGIYFDFPWLGL